MRRLRVLAIPRDPTPYQELLYQALRARGVTVRYAGTLTLSRTLNLLLLPLELLVARARGYRIFHVHWTFGFTFPVLGDSRQARRMGRWWFGLVLRVAQGLGVHPVWTAHNVLPHTPVFDDDVKARRTLVSRSDLVIAHSAAALRELARLGAEPRHSEIVAHGPISPPELLSLAPPVGGRPRTIVFVGRIAAYKGIEDLVGAVSELAVPMRVIVAGSCADPDLERRLARAAAGLEDRLELSFGHLPDPELARLIGSADALVFPFRAITTSSSLMLGLSAGRMAIVPDLPGLAELPDAALVRYPPGRAGLAGALLRTAEMPAAEIAEKGLAARAAATAVDWEEIAERTEAALRRTLARRAAPKH